MNIGLLTLAQYNKHQLMANQFAKSKNIAYRYQLGIGSFNCFRNANLTVLREGYFTLMIVDLYSKYNNYLRVLKPGYQLSQIKIKVERNEI